MNEDGIWCPRCGEVFHDEDMVKNPEEYHTCQECGCISHQKCRGPIEPKDEVRKCSDRVQSRVKRVKQFFDEHPIHAFKISEMSEYLEIVEIDIAHVLFELLEKEYVQCDYSTGFALFKRNLNAGVTYNKERIP